MVKYVMKFGGTSLKDAAAIERARRIVQNFYEEKKPEQLVVVVSAQGKINNTPLGDKVTNLLERANKYVSESNNEIVRRTLQSASELGIEKPTSILEELLMGESDWDETYYSKRVSFGERISSNLVGKYFSKFMPTQTLNAFELGMLTIGEKYANAKLSEEALPKIKRALYQQSKIVVVPGFLGYNSRNEITTLGRDGSNYSATTIGRAIGAAGVYIFSDEPGVRRASPKHIPDGEILKKLTYAEAIEFAELGAKIINAKSVIPARDGKIPVHIVDENYNGTEITNQVEIEHQGAKIIASSAGHHLLNIQYDEDKPGVIAEITDCFEKADINIEAISDERHSLSIAHIPGDEHSVNMLIRILGDKYEYSMDDTFSRISIIGEGMRGQKGLLARITSCFARENISIDMISQGLNQLNITTFIPQEHEACAVNSLYNELFRKI